MSEVSSTSPPAAPRGEGAGKAYAAELFGTFTLVFMIAMAITVYASPGSAATTNLNAIALIHVFALFMLVQTLGVISGCHLNPAVTIALASLKRTSGSQAVIYIVMQLAGAVLAALLVRYLLGAQAAAVNFGAVSIAPTIGGTVHAMVLEAIGTFFLVWAIVGVAVSGKGDKAWAGLVIGATLGLIVYVAAPLTGAGFNPARAFGPGLVSGEWGGIGTFLLVYVLAPIVGGVVAARAYTGLASD